MVEPQPLQQEWSVVINLSHHVSTAVIIHVFEVKAEMPFPFCSLISF